MKLSVLLLPINSKRKILLQHRSKDAPTYPDQWGFFGGSIENNETPVDAIRREIKEELGLSLENLYFITSILDDEDKIERYIFKSFLDIDVGVLKSQQREGDDLAFFPFEELKELPMMTDSRLKILEKLGKLF
jgi:8-oxo-dGTP pyrophosphatase MutT (NUDIX family)